MKKLQNNFTTPEQSRRLLELGLPADSADMYYLKYGTTPIVWEEWAKEDRAYECRKKDTIPCWSVGRLIEIFCSQPRIHSMDKDEIMAYLREKSDMTGYLVTTICAYDDELDFSKLEE